MRSKAGDSKARLARLLGVGFRIQGFGFRILPLQFTHMDCVY